MVLNHNQKLDPFTGNIKPLVFPREPSCYFCAKHHTNASSLERHIKRIDILENPLEC